MDVFDAADPPPGLSVPPTSLVGREAEVAAIIALLAEPAARLLTLTGPGGVGKTRLALAAAAAADFPEPVRVVGLAQLADPALVSAVIARALGVRDADAMPLPGRVAALLRGRRVLLVLDNCEHVVEAVAPLAAGLLAACPDLAILATSRIRLRISGEWEVPVPPLGLAAETGGEAAAVRLFAERARAVRPDFALDSANADAILAICRRLDGLPLAIELAAARVKVLPPAALLARLDPALPLLTGGARDLPARQQTVRDAIAWSHDLLPPAEQGLFRRLAVFVGGFTLEAAADVVGDGGGRVLDGVAALVEHSLLRQEDGPGGEPRFAMLETVREFGLERLEAAGEAQRLRAAHAAWCLAFAEDCWGRFAAAAVGPGWMPRAGAEHGNLRAALAWLDETGDVAGVQRLAGSIWPLWFVGSHRAEGRTWLCGALETGVADPSIAMRVLYGAAMLIRDAGDLDGSTRLAEECLAQAVAVGDRWWRATGLDLLGDVAAARGDYGEAESRGLAALALFEEFGSAAWVAYLRLDLGRAAFGRGDHAEATDYLDAALAGLRSLGHTYAIAQALSLLGMAACARGDCAVAAARLADAYRAWRSVGTREDLAEWFASVAVVAGRCGRPEWAAQLLGVAAAIGAAVGHVFMRPESAAYEEARNTARDALGPAAFSAAYEAGLMQRQDDALSAALEILAAAAPPAGSDPAFGLTPREREVLSLVVAGRSIAAIAETLFVSPRTVTTHLTRIYGKLGVATRAEATALALREGLA